MRAVVAILLAFIAKASTATVVETVDWTGSVSGTWSYGTVTGTTGSGVSGAGQIFGIDWSTLPFAAGYSTTVNEAMVLAAANNAGAVPQSMSFTQAVQSPYLFFNYIDNGTSFDFGSYNWALVGATSASRVGSSMVVNGSGDLVTDGFLVVINETFGPGADLAFDFVNPTSTGSGGGHTVGYTLGVAVPEIDPAGFGSVAALLTGALGLIERRRLKAKAA